MKWVERLIKRGRDFMQRAAAATGVSRSYKDIFELGGVPPYRKFYDNGIFVWKALYRGLYAPWHTVPVIAAGVGAVAKYEKAFLVSGGNFVPLVEGKPKRSVGIWRRYGGWSIAAMLMICLGATWMLYQEQLKSHEALRLENIRRVKAGDAEVPGISLISPATGTTSPAPR